MFPALSVLSYQTVILQNCGDLPLTFYLDHSSNPLAKSMSVVPSCGLIQSGKHQILTLITTPTEDSPKQGFSLRLQLNAAKHIKVVYTLHRNTENKSSSTHHTVLEAFSIRASVSVSFRNWQLSVWWKSCVCLWKEEAVCISSQQRWAHECNAPTSSGTSAAYLYGWLAEWLLFQFCISDIFHCIVSNLVLSQHH